MITYLEKLKDPRWQKCRLFVLDRDGWACRSCGSKEETLHVHHTYYERGLEPWDYPAMSLLTLCEECHEEETTERRRAEENTLINALRRRGYLSSDINSIMYDIYNLTTGKNLEFLCEFFKERFEIEKKYE